MKGKTNQTQSFRVSGRCSEDGRSSMEGALLALVTWSSDTEKEVAVGLRTCGKFLTLIIILLFLFLVSRSIFFFSL